jgi:hypothetical protein
LLEWLLSTTADFTAALGVMCTLTSSSKLSNDNLVDQWDVGLHIKDVSRKFRSASDNAAWALYIYSSHGLCLL